jgi:hypothetical protein
MCCLEDGCECGDFEPRPGMRNPVIEHEGEHPFLKMLVRSQRFGQ